MISPEYKVVNDNIFLPESGSGLKSKTRIKFIQEGVALYDGGAYIGQFISSTGDKITLDENKNVIIPGDSGSGLDLNKLKESDSIKIEKSTEDKTATFSVKENYLKSFIDENVSIVAKPDGGVVVEKLSDEKASSYELSLDDNYHIDEHSWEVDDPPKLKVVIPVFLLLILNIAPRVFLSVWCLQEVLKFLSKLSDFCRGRCRCFRRGGVYGQR